MASKLGNVLKKVGGVVASVASVAAKSIPVVGNLVSGALSNVSTKLLASPTPQKESAAALTSQLVQKVTTSTSAPNPVATTLKSAISTAISGGLAAAPVLKLVTQPPIPPAVSTPVKAASIPLQVSTSAAYIPPTPSTPIKQSSYDLTGQAPPAPPDVNVVKTASPMQSFVTEAPPTKTPQQMADGESGGKKDKTTMIVAIVGGILLVFVLIFSLFSKRRR